MDIVQVIAIIVSGSIFVAIIELIRRNRLKERYSLIWLAASALLIVLSVWRGLLHFIARSIGIYYPPSFLFLLAIFFLLLLLLHFSVILSSLSENNKRLAQEIGMLRGRIDLLEKGSSREGPPGKDD